MRGERHSCGKAGSRARASLITGACGLICSPHLDSGSTELPTASTIGSAPEQEACVVSARRALRRCLWSQQARYMSRQCTSGCVGEMDVQITPRATNADKVAACRRRRL